MSAHHASTADDPRRLREILDRALELAKRHSLTSVLVGLAGDEGDPVFPDLVAYVVSGLRVDDSVFRMTRERAVLLLADVGTAQAEAIVTRLTEEFAERFPAVKDVHCEVHCFEVAPDSLELTLKQVLPLLFPGPPAPH